MKKNNNKLDIDIIAEKITMAVGSGTSLIIHTMLFLGCFALIALGASADKIMLILTTIVSLEAIYLSLFIQISVNRSNRTIDDIQEDVEEISEDVEEIQKDIDDIQEDVEEISEDVDEIQKDIDDIQEDVDEIQEEVEDIEEEISGVDSDGNPVPDSEAQRLDRIERMLEALIVEIQSKK